MIQTILLLMAALTPGNVSECRDAMTRGQDQPAVDAFRRGDVLPGVIFAQDSAEPFVRFAMPLQVATRFEPGARVCLQVVDSERIVIAQVIRLSTTVDPVAQVRIAEARILSDDPTTIAPGTAVDVLPIAVAER